MQTRQQNDSIGLGAVRLQLPEDSAMVSRTEIEKPESDRDSQTHSARDPGQMQRKAVQMENGARLGEQCCVICCERGADAVLLPCNHGGLCFVCGVRLAKQHATCHFCRKVSGVYKGVEFLAGVEVGVNTG